MQQIVNHTCNATFLVKVCIKLDTCWKLNESKKESRVSDCESCPGADCLYHGHINVTAVESPGAVSQKVVIPSEEQRLADHVLFSCVCMPMQMAIAGDEVCKVRTVVIFKTIKMDSA